MQHQYRQKTKIKHADLPDLEQAIPSSKIECPSCSTPVSATEVNIHQMVGKCTACDSLFSLLPMASKLQIDSQFHHEELDRPAGVEINYFHNEMEISIQQPQVLSIIALIFAPVFLFLGILIFYKHGHNWALAMAIASAAVGGFGIRKYMNRRRYRTYVTISKHMLDIQHRPKNLVKDRSYSTADIEQFFVAGDPQLGGYAIFAVVNDIEGQKRQRIFGGLTSQVKAKYLEQELEKYLGIKNKKVIGELP